MSSIAEQDFNNKVEFMGDRINTCAYRFHQMLTTRRAHLKKMVDSPNDQEVKEQARSTVLSSADRYVNCLRNQYEDDIPVQMQPAVETFKRKLYTEVQPASVLEDQRLKIASVLYEMTKV